MRRRSPRKAAPTWLVGQKVRLRPIEPDDVEMLQRWINTSPAREFIFRRLPVSFEQERDWAANAAVNPNTPGYVIQTLAGADVGTISLHIEGARATLGIAIYEQRYWARGLGTDAVRVLVDAAFRTRPLVRIELTVLPDNARAIACYERAGFAREGVMRRWLWRDGEYCDVVLMSIVHDDWAATRTPLAKRR
ncbi:MAG: GNAT family N-acetyltransferase [Candidatus Eremiobacteraeota bacterium]|nr:GNAT family N-acetyltransferase [Candidatus Eremiobacteraeota bacterium]MBV8281032.1 GNAT family N-acetyltransferase [Candidatus Eremiobacteraeota bacterium]